MPSHIKKFKANTPFPRSVICEFEAESSKAVPVIKKGTHSIWKNQLITTVCIIICAWLYISGNLPYVGLPYPNLVKAANIEFPKAAFITSKLTHWALNDIRGVGLDIPLTYTEKIIKIIRLRREVAIICDRIIIDQHRRLR